MKKYLLLLTGLIFFAYSCRDDSLADKNSLFYDENEVLASCIKSFMNYKATDTELPVAKSAKGNRITKTIVFKNSSGTFSMTPNPGYCGAFSPPLQFAVEGGGIATHLGQVTVLNLACVDINGQFVSPVYGFVTAANGDEIHTIMGMPYPDPENPLAMYYPYYVMGGTGRFEGAEGLIVNNIIADFTTGTWTLTGTGELTY